MSFALSMDGGALEWASHGLGTIFAQRENLWKASFWRMIYDVLRFGLQAPKVLFSFQHMYLCILSWRWGGGVPSRPGDHFRAAGKAVEGLRLGCDLHCSALRRLTPLALDYLQHHCDQSLARAGAGGRGGGGRVSIMA